MPITMMYRAHFVMKEASSSIHQQWQRWWWWPSSKTPMGLNRKNYGRLLQFSKQHLHLIHSYVQFVCGIIVIFLSISFRVRDSPMVFCDPFHWMGLPFEKKSYPFITKKKEISVCMMENSFMELKVDCLCGRKLL